MTLDITTLRNQSLDQHQAACALQYISGLLNTIFTPSSPAAKAWIDMLDSLSKPIEEEGICFAGLLDAPAGKHMHHPERHGLLRHLLDMLQDWYLLSRMPGTSICLMAEQYAVSLIQSGACRTFEDAMRFIDQLMVTGILSHDLHKAYRHYTMTIDPSDTLDGALPELYKFDYANKYQTLDIPDVLKSLSVLGAHGIIPTDLLLQQINDAEGGYAKMPSRSVNVLTKALYLLDEMSVLRWRSFARKFDHQRR